MKLGIYDKICKRTCTRKEWHEHNHWHRLAARQTVEKAKIGLEYFGWKVKIV